MTGYIRQDTANNISNGSVVNADDLDAEFDAIEDAFSASIGHVHDGTSGSGAPILVVGPAQNVVVSGTSMSPKTDNVIDLGTSLLEYKDLWIDGVANIDSLVADTADINAGTIDATVIGATTPAAGSFTTVNASGTITGNVTGDLTGNAATATKLATARTITLSGDVAGSASFDGSANVTITTTVQADSVALGTDTTGNYVAGISGTTNQVTVTSGTGEGVSPVVSLPATLVVPGTLTVTGAATITSGAISGITDLAIADGGTGASTAANARTNLGLGTIATQAASSVTITGGSITGITDLAVADGGTGASTLTGYVKGAGTTALTASATIPNTDITGLGTMSTQNASSVTITGGTISGITDLAVADGGTGASTLTGYVKGAGTSALTASATIPNTDITGLGTMSTQGASAVTITGGSITGITDLAIADGGTGASTAAAALVNFGLTATAAELNIMDGVTASTTEINYVGGVTSAIQTQLDAKAPLASPALTGTPTAPTAANLTNTTQLATTAFVLANVPLAGAMTLLGTLNTTSGTTQTLSGLTLTSYAALLITVDNVSHDAAGLNRHLRLGGQQVSCNSGTETPTFNGPIFVSLTSGVASSIVGHGNSTPSFRTQSVGVTTASTSLSFTLDASGNFDLGVIKVWGLK